MKEQLQKRLVELQSEFDAGKRMIEDLDMQRTRISETMLRLSGAIQVLQEELVKEESGQTLPEDITNL